MRVNRIERMTLLYNSLHKRPQYNETTKKKSEEDSQFEELMKKLKEKERLLKEMRPARKDNPCEKEVDMEALQNLFRRKV
jgi:type I restriction-modification system DNA methylase subunit